MALAGAIAANKQDVEETDFTHTKPSGELARVSSEVRDRNVIREIRKNVQESQFSECGFVIRQLKTIAEIAQYLAKSLGYALKDIA